MPQVSQGREKKKMTTGKHKIWKHTVRVCSNPRCSEVIQAYTLKGRPRMYCCDACRRRHKTRIKKPNPHLQGHRAPKSAGRICDICKAQPAAVYMRKKHWCVRCLNPEMSDAEKQHKLEMIVFSGTSRAAMAADEK